MKSLKQIQTAQPVTNKLTTLVGSGLLKENEVTLINRAMDRGNLRQSPAEHNALVDLVEKLISEDAGIAAASSGFKGMTDVDITRIPPLLILKRRAIRVFPGGEKVALYWADKINKYISVPFQSIGIQEDLQESNSKAFTADDWNKLTPAGKNRLRPALSPEELKKFEPNGPPKQDKDEKEPEKPASEQPKGTPVKAQAQPSWSVTATIPPPIARQKPVAPEVKINQVNQRAQPSLQNDLQDKIMRKRAMDAVQKRQQDSEAREAHMKRNLAQDFAHYHKNIDADGPISRVMTAGAAALGASIGKAIYRRKFNADLKEAEIPEVQPPALKKPPVLEPNATPVAQQPHQFYNQQPIQAMQPDSSDYIPHSYAHPAFNGHRTLQGNLPEPEHPEPGPYDRGALAVQNVVLSRRANRTIADQPDPDRVPARREVAEDVLKTLKTMVENKIESQDIIVGKDEVPVTETMARRIINLSENVNKKNKAHLQKLLNENSESFYKVLEFAVRRL